MRYITHTDAHYSASSVRTNPRYNKAQLKNRINISLYLAPKYVYTNVNNE